MGIFQSYFSLYWAGKRRVVKIEVHLRDASALGLATVGKRTEPHVTVCSFPPFSDRHVLTRTLHWLARNLISVREEFTYSGLSAYPCCIFLHEYFQAITVPSLFVCTVKSMFSTWSHAQPLNAGMAECTEREKEGERGETRRGPRCLWCGLMGRTGERVPQSCVSRIFDRGSQRREQRGTTARDQARGKTSRKAHQTEL